MNIWVDSDACPLVIREILIKAAIRTGIRLTFIANHPIKVPALANIKSFQVAKGFDVADNEIVLRCQAGDLIITSDIPLAAEVIEKGALALSPRGELFNQGNIGARLNMRDFMDSMRETLQASGASQGGPPPLGKSDRMAFANQLDRYLTKIKA
ncbi:YaiI/YqxD family protein [Kangiella sp. TOML190]|uniref:YaiI/YqxD family protein n=1 Tax=Kangiella sp. TOML190 TaxID=2931351 RepID=UPI0020415FBB|nr:YaiI/YqxD family protein [Kangiella sp. TOML190]